MGKSLDAVPYKQRQWGHAVARNAINAKQKLGLGLKKQKGAGVLDKPLEVAKFAETLTETLTETLYSIGIGQVILRKMLSQDQLVSQARNFGLIRKKVLSCVW